ncbi:acyclic terpene utilization AtuA family protein [uncultured Ferrimonas sp.]|uniref:acyclic terpene utilization AtuA family protein n=1 Tax=uncultured Ferrimonas sp. TaxID=432640 RepID=UPI002620D86E|nr:acyclic terpene utilization AtuA family protein [uncultured Ferrimonas sp.]
MNDTSNPIRIGGASGYWGDAAIATPQLLASGDIDYLVYDYLAEITMSILARARQADPSLGYATDFVSAAMKPNLATIAAKGVKVISNAGGINPHACAAALRQLIAEAKLSLTVAVISGDDLAEQMALLQQQQPTEMFTGAALPPPERIASANAYLGAAPIAAALAGGADIVITGRCVDSAVTLGACLHHFGWQRDQFDLLAQASLAGHIIECGAQACGGNFTDYLELSEQMAQVGYPIAEISADGQVVISKAADSGGLVSVATVAEQMLYEIGDPQCYLLPDVICDFSEVVLSQQDNDQVRLTGARGHGAPSDYKVSLTYADGYRGGHVFTIYGQDAAAKADKFAHSVLARASDMLKRYRLPPFTETSVEVIGADSQFGAAAPSVNAREVDLKIAARHPSGKGIGVLLKELVGMALSGPPGLTGFAGARPKPSPVIKLFSCLLPKSALAVQLDLGDGSQPRLLTDAELGCPPSVAATHRVARHVIPTANLDGDTVQVPLQQLAWGRSGDKGDNANVGIIARQPQFLPYIAASLSCANVAERFRHFFGFASAQELSPDTAHAVNTGVERFYLPGSHSLNFLLHQVLGGGGVASLRVDPQGKGYAQLLLAEPIVVPAAVAQRFGLQPITQEQKA